MHRFKKNDAVRITSGKFAGWRGTVWEHELDPSDRWHYYSIFPDYKQKRGGKVYARDAGLGVIINIPEQHLKEIK